MKNSVEETINERRKDYGDLDSWAEIFESLKKIAHDANNQRINPIQASCLDMIFLKLSRILNGNPNKADNWHDIAGYAKLVEDWINKNEEHLVSCEVAHDTQKSNRAFSGVKFDI